MDQAAVVTVCKELGCCDACCIRYLGVKNHTAYENPQKYLLKYKPVEKPTNSTIKDEGTTTTPTTNPTSKPDSTSFDPTTKPASISIGPTTKPEPMSVDPTSKIVPTSIDPTTKPDPMSVDPTSKPEHTSFDLTTKPDPTSIDPTTKPDPMSVDPASKTDSILVNPTSILDPTSRPDPAFKPDPISVDPTSKPEHTSFDLTTKPDPTSNDPTTKHDPMSVDPAFKTDPISVNPTSRPDPAFKPDPISVDPTSVTSTSISDPATIANRSPTIAAASTAGSTSPPPKRRRTDVCNTCLGLLQESSWEECCNMAKEMLEEKGYECDTFACALLAPNATLVREKAAVLRLQASQRAYDPRIITALKEAWKWSLGPRLAQRVRKKLDSGAVCPLLVSLNMEYQDELKELEILKTLSPRLFASRNRQRNRFAVEFTRRSVEQALDGVTLAALQRLEGWREGLPTPACAVKCIGVSCAHSPVYLGGRYVKLSRKLPQTPWVVGGKRIMESSVQEIIMEPLAKLYQIPAEHAERRFKFMSAGREDVDVRCLRDGRPFALEISDPRRQLTAAELQTACDAIATSGSVLVHKLVPVTKEQLTLLKQGEESKTKCYEALCVKIHRDRTNPLIPTVVTALPITAEDISRINSYRNTPPGDPARVVLSQKTPIRVIHRRPLLTRTRKILELTATEVKDQPQLFVVRIRTEAGTYVKEWVHGELGRTEPCLGDALGAEADILALDVAGIDLVWPPGT